MKKTNKPLETENLNLEIWIKSRNMNTVMVSPAPFLFTVWLLKTPYMLV